MIEYEVYLRGQLLCTTALKADIWLMPGRDYIWEGGKRYPVQAVSGTRVTVGMADKEVNL